MTAYVASKIFLYAVIVAEYREKNYLSFAFIMTEVKVRTAQFCLDRSKLSFRRTEKNRHVN